MNPAIDRRRLLDRLDALAAIGRQPSGACCRLALTDDDRAGRDQVVAWMRALGLAVSIDPIGNIFALRAGRRPELAPVMTGSHIDTVRTGGLYDGNLGVLQAGALEESNVDITGELVNMITAQRIYQANAQSIKTIDQVMQTIVNLR